VPGRFVDRCPQVQRQPHARRGGAHSSLTRRPAAPMPAVPVAKTRRPGGRAWALKPSAHPGAAVRPQARRRRNRPGPRGLATGWDRIRPSQAGHHQVTSPRGLATGWDRDRASQAGHRQVSSPRAPSTGRDHTSQASRQPARASHGPGPRPRIASWSPASHQPAQALRRLLVHVTDQQRAPRVARDGDSVLNDPARNRGVSPWRRAAPARRAGGPPAAPRPAGRTGAAAPAAASCSAGVARLGLPRPGCAAAAWPCAG
jgi:hypothetical protein